ncbi:hypothetical protein [Lactococcus protaetiae]|uniref:hypothetical protein n=1 Tax=Lactococcus protaetiae TaxID=2592653 RepID=UPI001CC21E2F|nr:hypothetical protein [Lactococcus protaetiae]
MIEGLQHELGITSLVENFGATTASLYDQKVTPNSKQDIRVITFILSKVLFGAKE